MPMRLYKTVFLIALLALTACAESNFDLSKTSRIPKWFSMPAGLSREDVTVTLDYYIVPTEKSVFTLYDKKGKELQRINGKRYGGYQYPLTLKNPPPGYPNGYPSYEVIIANGIIDVVEHRQMEPIFYMTDDPAIWKEFGVKQ